MLTIILVLVVIVIAVFLMGLDGNKPCMPLTGIALIMVAAFVGCWAINEPFYGYKEPVLKEEVALETLNISCKLDWETEIYLITSGDKMYLFKSNESDDVQTEGKDKVTYVQTDECKEPTLRIYEKKPKAGLFSFGGASVNELEFYLPENSVIEVS